MLPLAERVLLLSMQITIILRLPSLSKMIVCEFTMVLMEVSSENQAIRFNYAANRLLQFRLSTGRAAV